MGDFPSLRFKKCDFGVIFWVQDNLNMPDKLGTSLGFKICFQGLRRHFGCFGVLFYPFKWARLNFRKNDSSEQPKRQS